MLAHRYSIIGLSDIGCTEEIAESGTTLEENSKIKAEYVWKNFHYNCFADDTGLEVDALNGDPGVRTARYAGNDRDSLANMQLLLDRLQKKKQQKSSIPNHHYTFLAGENASV